MNREPLCGDLPLDVTAPIFFPVTEGGQLLKTQPWPLPDSHEPARRYCGACPLQAECLSIAMAEDAWSFRALSPEERAAFGGARSKNVKQQRKVYLTREAVAGRIIDSGYDYDAIWAVLVEWEQKLASMSKDELKAIHVDRASATGWSSKLVDAAGRQLSGEAALQQLADAADKNPLTRADKAAKKRRSLRLAEQKETLF